MYLQPHEVSSLYVVPILLSVLFSSNVGSICYPNYFIDTKHTYFMCLQLPLAFVKILFQLQDDLSLSTTDPIFGGGCESNGYGPMFASRHAYFCVSS